MCVTGSQLWRARWELVPRGSRSEALASYSKRCPRAPSSVCRKEEPPLGMFHERKAILEEEERTALGIGLLVGRGVIL